jgi:hypothetical protein
VSTSERCWRRLLSNFEQKFDRSTISIFSYKRDTIYDTNLYLINENKSVEAHGPNVFNPFFLTKHLTIFAQTRFESPPSAENKLLSLSAFAYRPCQPKFSFRPVCFSPSLPPFACECVHHRRYQCNLRSLHEATALSFTLINLALKYDWINLATNYVLTILLN